MLLADAVHAVGGKLYVLGGGWSVMGPGPAAMSLALRFEVPWALTEQIHEWQLLLLDADGRSVRGEVGELAIRNPWPGMTRGFWGDRQRYLDTYWSRFDDLWVHGDWAYVDDDGFWFLQGRSDDTLKIAGKRLGPAEVESVLVGHAAVAEAGVIGVPHAVKGEAIVCFVVLRPGQSPSDSLRAELTERVARQMGKALKPERVLFARDLPRTRSAKIMRRVIRATYLGKEAGDLSSLENPAAVKAITDAV